MDVRGAPDAASGTRAVSCGEGVVIAVAPIGKPRSRQKSSRFCRLSTTIGWSAGIDADAIAAARR
jgi:hypothetical protein